MRKLVFLFVLWFAGLARADDAVECDGSRDVCDAKVLELCPSGADVLDEREVPSSSEGVARFRVTFRCRNSGAAEPPTGPSAGAVAPPVDTAAPVPSANADELADIDARLAELTAERNQHSLVGPLVLTGIGAGVALTLSVVAISAKNDADTLADGGTLGTSFDDDDLSNADEDEDTYRTMARVAGGLAVVGAGLAAGGAFWLWKRVAKRRENAPEMEQLRARQRELRGGVTLGFALDPLGRTLVLSGRF